MSKGRLEAFSDGVIAIIITIMVLELAPPHGAGLDDLAGLAPVFFAYALSFTHVGIYWNNHHHLFQAVKVVDGSILWLNLLLLFWLSLIPFATAWMGENEFASTPVAVYGVVFLLAAVAYYVLELRLVRIQPAGSDLAAAVGSDRKGMVSLLLYVIAVPVALVLPPISIALYIAVAILWVVPDRRIERSLAR